MKIPTLIFEVDDMFMGGEGSGCDPAVAESHGTQCGPVPKVFAPGSGKGAYAHFGKAGSKKVLGLFVANGAMAHLYQHMMTGEWHTMSSLQTKMTEWGSTAKLSYRLQCLQKIGYKHLGGQWQIEYKKDYATGEKLARLVVKKADNMGAGQVGVTGKQQQAALNAVQKLIGNKGLEDTISSKVWEEFEAELGMTLSDVRSAVGSWVGSVNSRGGLYMRKIAAEYYGRPFNSTTEHGSMVEQLSSVKESVRQQLLAVKALATEYARVDGTKVLYRGVHLSDDQRAKVYAAIKEGKSVEIPVNALSSWSTSKSKAEDFGNVTLKISVEPEDVWVTSKAMMHLFGGFKHEKEWIIGSKSPKMVFHPNQISIIGYPGHHPDGF